MKLLNKTVAVQGAYTLHELADEDRYTLSVIPTENCTLSQISATFSFHFQSNDALFLNGYQSWSFSPERGIHEYDKSLRHCPKFLDRSFGFSCYGDGHFYPPTYKRGLLHGYSYAYIRRGEKFFLFASLKESSGFTRIIFDTRKNKVCFEKDCAERVLDQSYVALDVVFLEGTENEVFDRWFALLELKALPAERAVGYTSWYNCYQDISAKRIESDLEGLKALPVLPDIFQIDDGFEPFVGDWLTTDKTKFPNGTKPIADRIIREGYRAGIWLAPFVCEKNSALYSEHPDYLLRNADGTPVYCGSNWSGAYALDFYKDAVRDYIRQTIEKYKAEGFSLFKLDFLYAVCMLPRPNKTRGEIMDEAMSFLRTVCGDAQIIGCGVPLAAAFGKVEYCRIGPDVTFSFDDKAYMHLLHAERPSTRHTMLNTVFRRQLSSRAFLNDPDVFILRDENTSLTATQKQALGTVNGLFGGLLFASDEFEKYDSPKKELYLAFTHLKNAQNVRAHKEKNRLILQYSIDGEEKTFSFNC
ncbi:MAG: alpha-galactosidase [Clostridia bacterium]|nr:alpha-galactosidase [Clostridia bacterium]